MLVLLLLLLNVLLVMLNLLQVFVGNPSVVFIDNPSSPIFVSSISLFNGLFLLSVFILLLLDSMISFVLIIIQ